MVLLQRLRFLLFAVTLCSILPSISLAELVRGRVIDGKTHEPLAGARIRIANGKGTVSGLDGSFIIRDLPSGEYTVRVTLSSYLTVTKEVRVSNNDVTLEIELPPIMGKSEELTVTGSVDHGSDMNGLKTVQRSENVINAVASRSIEVSPDISVADVSQRMSGVTMARTSSGDAQYAVIRGMDKRYNYTTVNGIKIPSPDNKNRFVPLDIFPSELLDRLEVTKSLLPSMEGDAIGGAMNMVMKQAPDHQILTAQIASGYSGLFVNRPFASVDFTSASQSPRLQDGGLATLSDFPLATLSPRTSQPGPNEYVAATYGDRYLSDGAFGVIVSGSYQNVYRGANTTFFQTDIAQDTNRPLPTELELRSYSTLQRRFGAMTNLDYKFDENNKIGLFGMYANLASNEVRETYDTTVSLGYPITKRLTHSIRTTNESQGISNATLNGSHRIFGDDLEAAWSFAYSRASLNRPDQANPVLDGGSSRQPDGSYSYLKESVNHATRRWSNNVDQDRSAYLTLKSSEVLLTLPMEFTYGGMYRSKLRASAYDEYRLNSANASTIQYYNGDITRDTFAINNTLGTPLDPLNYQAHENVTAGFAQAKLQIGKLSAIGGLRVENTDFGWLSNADSTFEGKSGTISYMDMLPSLSLKYSPSDNQNVRLSYFRSISRPGFYEVIPNNGIPGDDFTETTNDSLNRTQANNLDLRWELFPGGLDQLLVGAFYKQIQDPIESAVIYYKTSIYLQPRNFGTATNYGFEVDFRKYFSSFGIQGNYTFTNSSITTAKQVKYLNANGSPTVRMDDQTRPLQGQSAHIANLGLLYKDFESGTDAQISAVYTGPSISSVSFYKDVDVWQKGFLQVSLSGEQRISGALALYLKVTNLLNTAHDEVIHSPYVPDGSPMSWQTAGQDVLVRHELFDRTYLIGLRYKL